MLIFVARRDIVVDPFGEIVPVDVPCDQFNNSLFSEVSSYLRVIISLCHLGQQFFFSLNEWSLFMVEQYIF